MKFLLVLLLLVGCTGYRPQEGTTTTTTVAKPGAPQVPQ